MQFSELQNKMMDRDWVVQFFYSVGSSKRSVGVFKLDIETSTPSYRSLGKGLYTEDECSPKVQLYFAITAW